MQNRGKYLSAFEKNLENIQGPGVLKVRAWQCCVTFSQEAGILLFYVKPLVRNLIIFTCLTL